jgi:hypothetical protein
VAAERSGRSHLWLLLPAAALAAFWLAWRALALVDFLYPAFYELLGVHAHIEHFAPQNRYRNGFEQTTRKERERLFAGIVDAIHDSGRGLETLQYHDASGRPLGQLLREPEIAHLQDVSRLVGRVAPAGWIATAWLLVQLILIRRFGWIVPSLSRLMACSLGVTAAGVLVILLIGPREVFYAFHDWAFPPENPWFFYYQDSLMSTMMKAPQLFGAVAIALLLLALMLYAGFLYLARRVAGPGSVS